MFSKKIEENDDKADGEQAINAVPIEE